MSVIARAKATLSAAPAKEPPPVLSDEEQARADMRALHARVPGVFLSAVGHTGQFGTFASCCGSTVVQPDGTVYVGSYERPYIAPLDSETWMKEAKRYTSEWHYISHDDPVRRRGMVGPLNEREREQYENALADTARKLQRGNNPGVTLGVGLSKDDLISKMYTPDNPLYGTVEGLEWNDPDDGLISLIWTNA